ncbi:hypothetical protein SY83_21900 [Paenibacillus swuensis]|uniref:ABC transporter substrate-binding protein n=1 Tax=Paenibacillus swuensis TaxID=1178515 RepID=A0A172TNE2_9BACL|nr:extracellular solute-binding protein [Paenibacillus swuensis]ANE48496.1 hypothetical protein SY83_21900 [Paenibacillus swuensis]
MRKSMNSKIVWIVIAIASVTMLVACSGQIVTRYEQNAVTTPDSAPAKDGEIISFAFPTELNTQLQKELIGVFNESAGDMKAKAMPIPSDRYNQTLNMLMTSGSGPDIFYLHPEWLTSYIDKNWLHPIDSDSTFRRYPDWAVDYGTLGETTYTVFSRGFILRLLYNQDLFEWAGLRSDEPPATSTEFVQAAEQISAKGLGFKKYGYALPAGDEWEGYIRNVEMLSSYSGHHITNPSSGTFEFSKLYPWLEAWLELKKERGLFPGEASLKTNTAISLFKEGSVAMVLASNREIHSLFEDTDVPFRWSIAPPMKGSNDDQLNEYIIPDGLYVINRKTANPTLSLKLWEYLHSYEVEHRLLEESHMIPTAMDVIAKETEQGRPVFDLYNFPLTDTISHYTYPFFNHRKYASDYISSKGRAQAYRSVLEDNQPLDSVLREMDESLDEKFIQ